LPSLSFKIIVFKGISITLDRCCLT
jgi:hypothetical protein